MSNRKKKIVFHSDSSPSFTGFGRNTKAILTYLHKTGKYDIVEFCCNKLWSNDVEHQRKPWKSFGTVPDNPMEANALAPDENQKRAMAYGLHLLDKVIYQEKPDVYFAVQDIWGVDFAIDRPWFSNITSVIWTTLDSRPLLKSAIDVAPKVKNYWVWSNFAEKDMHKLEHSHVKTVHGAVDTSKFSRLRKQERAGLRQRSNIPLDAFIVGFVFRNQLRKSVFALMRGYAAFKAQNPEIKRPRLLLHTHFPEGWDIMAFANEFKIPTNEILTTYICGKCKHYQVQEYKGEGIQCPSCQQNTFGTTHPGNGVSEHQLNEVYNLMDCYVHPITSGGLEIPIIEAKLTELVTLVTNYSCGEEMCEDAACSLPLEWQEYREPGSQFIKAATAPFSITKQLTKYYKMSASEKERMGKQARQWVIDNFSTEVIGKYIEKFIDESPFTEYKFEQEKYTANPHAPVKQDLPELEWILELYKNILGKTVDKYDSGVRQWLEHLKRKAPRQNIENYFRQQAAAQVQQEKKTALFEKLQKDPAKKLLYVMPASERDVFLSTALFKSIKEQYPEHKLIIATDNKFFSVLDGNPYIDEVIQYYPDMDNLLFMEGAGNHKGCVDLCFLPFHHTQRAITYTHSGKTNIALECLKYQ